MFAHHKVSVPANTHATVTVPLDMIGVSATATISEAVHGSTVWKDGEFVPGTPGVTGGAASQKNVVFDVGSGDYNFHVILP